MMRFATVTCAAMVLCLLSSCTGTPPIVPDFVAKSIDDALRAKNEREALQPVIIVDKAGRTLARPKDATEPLRATYRVKDGGIACTGRGISDAGGYATGPVTCDNGFVGRLDVSPRQYQLALGFGPLDPGKYPTDERLSCVFTPRESSSVHGAPYISFCRRYDNGSPLYSPPVQAAFAFNDARTRVRIWIDPLR
ncbi:hypothetical protein [Pseudohalocynthiibacter sp. F2068]|jgi:hypothetical protein|uniref:hypothetical protein n=1 Tax=Pseudohalocynthiibacter sp. F2068 TaxID=2926418 RepID=UPI001FF643E8|nr:hypothetical protein [Pseudohalocynthiibacter sp. F2068]